MNKFIFSDILSIKNKGMESFKNSEKWPVSEEEFQEFSGFIYQQYEEIILNLEDDLFDIALIDYKFQGVLLQIFHYNYVKNYAHKNDIDVISEGDSQIYLHPDWDRISRQYSLFKPHHSKLIRFIRRAVKNIIFNKHLSFYKVIRNLFSSDNFVSIGSSSSLKKDFVLKEEIYCDHQEAYDLLNFYTDKEELANKYHQELMDKLVSPYLKKLKFHKTMFLDGINISDIELCWSGRIKEIIPAYINILNSNSDKNFLVTEASSLMNRILIIGYQRIGCKVFGFHHGGDFVASIINQAHKNAMSHCQNLIVPTKGIADQYRKTYSCLELEAKIGTKYYPVEKSTRLFFNDKKTLRHKKNIKTVMLMGFPMSCQRRVGESGLFFLSKIDIEFNILTMLKESGLNVLYKAHPDRKDEVDGFFNSVANEVVYDKFENSWERADAFIFTYTSTTTFPFALTTDRKVVLIDVDANLVDKELREELGKRVDYVPATIKSDGNLIQFDEASLKRCLLS